MGKKKEIEKIIQELKSKLDSLDAQEKSMAKRVNTVETIMRKLFMYKAGEIQIDKKDLEKDLKTLNTIKNLYNRNHAEKDQILDVDFSNNDSIDSIPVLFGKLEKDLTNKSLEIKIVSDEYSNANLVHNYFFNYDEESEINEEESEINEDQPGDGVERRVFLESKIEELREQSEISKGYLDIVNSFYEKLTSAWSEGTNNTFHLEGLPRKENKEIKLLLEKTDPLKKECQEIKNNWNKKASVGAALFTDHELADGYRKYMRLTRIKKELEKSVGFLRMVVNSPGLRDQLDEGKELMRDADRKYMSGMLNLDGLKRFDYTENNPKSVEDYILLKHSFLDAIPDSDPDKAGLEDFFTEYEKGFAGSYDSDHFFLTAHIEGRKESPFISYLENLDLQIAQYEKDERFKEGIAIINEGIKQKNNKDTYDTRVLREVEQEEYNKLQEKIDAYHPEFEKLLENMKNRGDYVIELYNIAKEFNEAYDITDLDNDQILDFIRVSDYLSERVKVHENDIDKCNQEIVKYEEELDELTSDENRKEIVPEPSDQSALSPKADSSLINSGEAQSGYVQPGNLQSESISAENVPAENVPQNDALEGGNKNKEETKQQVQPEKPFGQRAAEALKGVKQAELKNVLYLHKAFIDRDIIKIKNTLKNTTDSAYKAKLEESISKFEKTIAEYRQNSSNDNRKLFDYKEDKNEDFFTKIGSVKEDFKNIRSATAEVIGYVAAMVQYDPIKSNKDFLKNMPFSLIEAFNLSFKECPNISQIDSSLTLITEDEIDKAAANVKTEIERAAANVKTEIEQTEHLEGNKINNQDEHSEVPENTGAEEVKEQEQEQEEKRKEEEEEEEEEKEKEEEERKEEKEEERKEEKKEEGRKESQEDENVQAQGERSGNVKPEIPQPVKSFEDRVSEVMNGANYISIRNYVLYTAPSVSNAIDDLQKSLKKVEDSPSKGKLVDYLTKTSESIKKIKFDRCIDNLMKDETQKNEDFFTQANVVKEYLNNYRSVLVNLIGYVTAIGSDEDLKAGKSQLDKFMTAAKNNYIFNNHRFSQKLLEDVSKFDSRLSGVTNEELEEAANLAKAEIEKATTSVKTEIEQPEHLAGNKINNQDEHSEVPENTGAEEVKEKEQEQEEKKKEEEKEEEKKEEKKEEKEEKKENEELQKEHQVFGKEFSIDFSKNSMTEYQNTLNALKISLQELTEKYPDEAEEAFFDVLQDYIEGFEKLDTKSLPMDGSVKSEQEATKLKEINDQMILIKTEAKKVTLALMRNSQGNASYPQELIALKKQLMNLPEKMAVYNGIDEKASEINSLVDSQIKVNEADRIALGMQNQSQLGNDEPHIYIDGQLNNSMLAGQQENTGIQQNIIINENNINYSTMKNNKGLGNDGSQPSQDNREEQLKNDIMEIRKKFRKRANDLEKAKSPWKNSQEYQNLIDEVKAIGGRSGDETSIFPDYQDLYMTPAEHFAQELYRIHELTEKYLEHKAKDGVNKNAYMKLCVVEETSKLIKDALAITGKQRLPYNMERNNKNQNSELPVYTGELKISLSQCLNVPLLPEVTDQIPVLNDDDCSLLAGSYGVQNKKKADAIGKGNIKRVVKDVDDCMGKILLKAMNKPAEQIDRSMVRALADMRTNFRENPFPKMEKELTQAIKNENTVVQGPTR